MNNLENFIRKDIDILLENEILTDGFADFLIALENDGPWQDYAYWLGKHALANAKKIVKENEEAGL